MHLACLFNLYAQFCPKSRLMTDLAVFAAPQRRPLHRDITEDLIRDVVHAFYDRVRRDDTLGPIFETAIGETQEDWQPHLARMCAFWSSVTRLTGRYKGNPMHKHARLDGIRTQHFDRWLSLFAETVAERCDPDVAAIFIDKAQRMSATIQRGVFQQRV